MIKIIKSFTNNKTKAHIFGLNDATAKSIRRAFYEIGKDLTKEARDLINKKPKHGRQYLKRISTTKKRLKKSLKYTASAPGEAPAVVSGELRKSLNFLVRGYKEVEVGVDLHFGKAPYGKYLEYKNLIAMQGQGSRNILPRPYLSGAYKNRKHAISDLFIKNLKMGIK